MNLATDLLEQAKMLANLDLKRPKQVNLRRSVSAAYYALFHLLSSEATALVVRDDFRPASRLNRTINHADMDKVSKSFAENRLPKCLARKGDSFSLPSELIQVAKAFSGLQEARHEADYDHSRTFSRDETIGFVNTADSAFAAWSAVRQTDAARLFLTGFSMWGAWNKPPRGKGDQ